MSKYTYQISLEIKDPEPQQADLIRGSLINIGIPSQNLIETVKEDRTILSVYFDQRQPSLLFRNRMNRWKLPGVKIRFLRLEKADWRTKWRDQFSAFALLDRFRVIPSWQQGKVPSGKRTPIWLNIGLAFGTGTHATTREMARLIVSKKGKFESFLDVGTGSGILTIVAMKSGAKEAVAIDLSPDAVKEAKGNLQINDVKGVQVKRVELSSSFSGRKFDFVAANLISKTLIRYRKRLCRFVREGKYLAISGISSDNLEEVRAAFKPLPLRCLRVLKSEGWCAILYQRTPKNV